MLKIIDNKKFTKKMGEDSYEYYSENCTMENKANGIIEIIER